MKSKLIEVKNLTVQVGERQLVLTVDECKALQKALNDAFPIAPKVQVVEKIEYRDRPISMPDWNPTWDKHTGPYQSDQMFRLDSKAAQAILTR